MNMPASDPMANRKAWLAGGGIASLAAAVFLIRDAKMPGGNITIFKGGGPAGGSLDGAGSAEEGYIIRGGGMLNFTYYCTYEMLSSIPSFEHPGRSVYDDIVEFNEKVKTRAHARLIDRSGKIVDSSRMGFQEKDRIELLCLMTTPEKDLDGKQISDWFTPHFFTTNFWYIWCTTFAFQPWHSLMEFRRYLHRFVYEFPRIHTLEGVQHTPYDQFDSIIRPVMSWLQEQGVHIEMQAQVKELSFAALPDRHTVSSLRYAQCGSEKEIQVAAGDIVFVTNGSMTAASSLGSTFVAPIPPANPRSDGAWALWENISKRSPVFGRPEVFSTRTGASMGVSFTVTSEHRIFFSLMEAFTGNEAGTGAMITLKDSNWLLSIVLARQPHFIGQPEEVTVFWGYGLSPDREGNYVAKKMKDCTGAEIMTELLSHLSFMEFLPAILQTSRCIPCVLPYITSGFLPRGPGDRPHVVPKRSTNLAFLGQFTEIPEDVVSTVEYSVRSAQMAVYRLLNIDKKIPALFKEQQDMQVLYRAVKTLHH
jgi:oleate hydratase